MTKLHCPECQSDNVKPIAIGKNPTSFALIAMRKDNLPGGSLYVNLICCTDCGFTWLKLTDKSAEFINNHQD